MKRTRWDKIPHPLDPPPRKPLIGWDDVGAGLIGIIVGWLIWISIPQ